MIAQGFENDIEYDSIVSFAVEHGLTERKAQTAFLVFQEACGCVFAEEQNIRLPKSYDIHERRKNGKISNVIIADDDLFQAAYFLAYNLRNGGRNDLSTKLVRHSSIFSLINNFLNADAKNSLEDMKDATIGPLQLLL